VNTLSSIETCLNLAALDCAGFTRLTARYHQALAITQQNSATQVAANRQGIAVASGREIDSPSFRPGAATQPLARRSPPVILHLRKYSPTC
jgi:hypothetical protein